MLFVGDKGMLLADYGKHVLLCRATSSATSRVRPSRFRSRSATTQEWIHACKTGAPTTCHFEYSGWLTEANHLGNVAYRVGKKLEWDAENMRATNAPEAEPFLTPRAQTGVEARLTA